MKKILLALLLLAPLTMSAQKFGCVEYEAIASALPEFAKANGELQALAGALDVKDAVLFAGHTEAVHEAVSDAELFVLSSNYEGMPNALLECMMMGMACISTRCEGATDVITHGVNGLLVDIGDTEALIAAMTALADDPDLRKRLAAEAKKTSAAYEKAEVVKQWLAIIE